MSQKTAVPILGSFLTLNTARYSERAVAIQIDCFGAAILAMTGRPNCLELSSEHDVV